MDSGRERCRHSAHWRTIRGSRFTGCSSNAARTDFRPGSSPSGSASPPSSLTFHVQHLHRAGLVTQRRLGRQLIYAADYAAMNGLVGYLTENCCGRGAAEQCVHAELRKPPGNPHDIKEPTMDSADIKEMVRNRYGSIAAASSSCCAPATSCCSPKQRRPPAWATPRRSWTPCRRAPISASAAAIPRRSPRCNRARC